MNSPTPTSPAGMKVPGASRGKRAKQKTLRVPEGVRWLLFFCASLCMGLCVAIGVLWINFESLTIVQSWAEKYTTYIPLTALLYAVPIFFLGAVLNRLWLSGLLIGVTALILGLVDHFKMAINGTPLELADFGLASQLGQVAGVAGELKPPADFWWALAGVLIATAVLFLLRRLLRLTGPRVRFLSVSLSLMLLVQLFSPIGSKLVGDLFLVDVYARMPAANNNRFHGLTIALWRSAVLQDTPAPEGYSPEYMESVLAEIDSLLAENGYTPAEETASSGDAVRPNVIMILSEAFFDITRLPDITYASDPLANFHALRSEGVSGTFHSHYLGYGTGYIEMAMQYGVNNLDFGSSTNICFLENGEYEKFDSLAEQFTKPDGYRAQMLHGYNDSLYNRTVTYPLLGYEELFFSADVQNLGFAWDEGVYGGYYLRDDYLYEGMLTQMKRLNEEGSPAFLFGITMENHQPFDVDKFDYQLQIESESDVLSEENMAIVDVMVEGVTRADQALGYLTEALRQIETPTVVVFFGDHRPNLFMTDGDTVYTKLGLCPGNETENWTADQINDIYSTDYLIWANDPALLGDAAGTERESSVTALGAQVLELLNQPRSRWWALQDLVSQVSLTNTELYFVDGSGAGYLSADDAPLSADARRLLELRHAVAYDAFYGKQYITEQMNTLLTR